MKKLLALLLTAVFVLSVMTSCSSRNNSDKATEAETTAEATEIATTASDEADLVVFAAASMKETLEAIAEKYKESHPEVSLTFNFESSGTLKEQIKSGADCDLFISAAQKQMNELEEGGYVDTNTRLNLLENKVTLAVTPNNPKGLTSFDDMKKHLELGDIVMAIGNSEVPVGQYTQKIFEYYGLDETELASKGVITYCSNVKEVTTQVSQETVDCGIIYQTDAFSADLIVADMATEEMCGQVIYPAAVLSESKNADATKEFLAYLQTKDASDIFKSVGFTPLSEQ